MIKPEVLGSELPYGPWSCRGCDVWDVICASANGDVATLRGLLARDPNLYRAEYWYTQPLHFAVREGYLEAARVLIGAGADPTAVRLGGEDPITVARDRGHEAVALLLEEARARRGRTTTTHAPTDHEVHLAAAAGDAARVRALLEAEPELVRRCDRAGGTPLHVAVAASAREVVALLLDRGADVHALHGPGPGSDRGYAAADFQPIDLALWNGPFWGVRADVQTARLLIERGATCDVVIAAALGDVDRVRRLLDEDPGRAGAARPSGKRALSSAVEFGHEAIARLLLERGADPNAPEGATAAQGASLHAAARAGDRAMVELLPAHGADPNGGIDSGGSATYAARTPDLRALLLARGGKLDPYDLVWLGDDDEAVRRVTQDPGAANAGCGGVLAAACTQGKRDLVIRLLEAGVRVPPVLTECRSYLWSDPGLLRLLVASGMDPDLPNWLRATPLHDLCGRDGRGRPNPHRAECATLLLDAGATISARDEDYRSTPLAWAQRRGHHRVALILRTAGATG